ncbi:hypothetical protein D3C77_537240 [compost metagenome]
MPVLSATNAPRLSVTSVMDCAFIRSSRTVVNSVPTAVGKLAYATTFTNCIYFPSPRTIKFNSINKSAIMKSIIIDITTTVA